MTDTLKPCRVSLYEDKGDKHRIYFYCHADDECHAEEQAINSYPNGEVIHIAEIDEDDYIS